jgi:hypothetical protein
MFARVTMTQAALDRADEAVRVNKERVIPGAEGIAGFKGGLWLLDRAAGKRLAITLFLTEEGRNGRRCRGRSPRRSRGSGGA